MKECSHKKLKYIPETGTVRCKCGYEWVEKYVLPYKIERETRPVVFDVEELLPTYSYGAGN